MIRVDISDEWNGIQVTAQSTCFENAFINRNACDARLPNLCRFKNTVTTEDQVRLAVVWLSVFTCVGLWFWY